MDFLRFHILYVLFPSLHEPKIENEVSSKINFIKLVFKRIFYNYKNNFLYNYLSENKYNYITIL